MSAAAPSERWKSMWSSLRSCDPRRVRSVARHFFHQHQESRPLRRRCPVSDATPADREIRDTGTSRSRAAVYKLHRRPCHQKASAGTFALCARAGPTVGLDQTLWTKRWKSVAQRSAGNLHQAREGLIELEHQKNRAGRRQRKNEQRTDNDSIGLGEQTEACKDYGEPEDERDQEGHGNRIVGLREQQYAYLRKLGTDLDCSI